MTNVMMNAMMKNSIRIVVCLMFIGANNALSQSNSKYGQLIQGRWIGTRKETKNGKILLANGKKLTEALSFEFKRNSQVFVSLNGEITDTVGYKIINNYLYTGGLIYLIERISSNELVLLDFDEKFPSSPISFRHYFRKKN
jgi:hypothetical protein